MFNFSGRVESTAGQKRRIDGASRSSVCFLSTFFGWESHVRAFRITRHGEGGTYRGILCQKMEGLYAWVDNTRVDLQEIHSEVLYCISLTAGTV